MHTELSLPCLVPQLFATEFESEARYAYSKRLFELGAPPQVVWPQQEASHAPPAGYSEAPAWTGETAYCEPQPLANHWLSGPAWENLVPPPPAQPSAAGGYAQPESWGVRDAPLSWGGEAPAWPGSEPLPFTENTAPIPPPLLSLAPIPAGWSCRPARREEAVPRAASSAAEEDVMAKLLSAMAVAAERRRAPSPEPPVAAAADMNTPVSAAAVLLEAARAHVAVHETAASEPVAPS